jgi:lysophospholipase L1-like esterase
LSRPGNYAVFLGDSITIGHDDPTNNIHADSWPTYAGLLSGQRIQTIRNAGVGGNTSAQMLARFDTDVTPYGPSLVTLLCGTNDIGGAVPFATFQANVQALVAKIRGIGAGPVLATIPPNNDSSRHANITLWNTWLRLYASRQGIPLLDFYAVLVDPANGNYLAANDGGDGTHPSNAGYLAMGAHAATALAPLLPTAYPPLPAENTQVQNLLTDGLFLGSVSGGIASGWGLYGSQPSGAVPSVVTDSNVLGKMQRVDATATTSDMLLVQNLGAPGTGGSGNYSIGDVLAVCGVMSNSGIGADCRVNFWPGQAAPAAVTQNVTRGVFYSLATVPSGTTTLDFLLYFRAGTGSAQFGRLGVYNLTRLGLA